MVYCRGVTHCATTYGTLKISRIYECWTNMDSKPIILSIMHQIITLKILIWQDSPCQHWMTKVSSWHHTFSGVKLIIVKTLHRVNKTLPYLRTTDDFSLEGIIIIWYLIQVCGKYIILSAVAQRIIVYCLCHPSPPPSPTLLSLTPAVVFVKQDELTNCVKWALRWESVEFCLVIKKKERKKMKLAFFLSSLILLFVCMKVRVARC